MDPNSGLQPTESHTVLHVVICSYSVPSLPLLHSSLFFFWVSGLHHVCETRIIGPNKDDNSPPLYLLRSMLNIHINSQRLCGNSDLECDASDNTIITPKMHAVTCKPKTQTTVICVCPCFPT